MPEARSCRLLLLRHAETSAPHLFHGAESDVGLSPRGQAQARAAASFLAPEQPAAVYSSAQPRAVATAQPIAAACRLPLSTIPTIHERRVGAMSGQPRTQLAHVYEEAKRRWMAGDLDHTHEGGESFAAIRDRVVPAFDALALRHPGQTIVVVAHGIVMRVLLCSRVEGRTFADFPAIAIDHVRVYELDAPPSGPWRLDRGPTVPPGLPEEDPAPSPAAPGPPAW
jgi:broad specificity phosphatase PhoE